MTIHDELVLKLIDPDPASRKPRGYIINIVNSSAIKYVLEDVFYQQNPETPLVKEYIKMTPDVVVTNLKSNKTTAVEVETDMKWDFADSIRQLKKYKKNRRDFQDVVVIIPKKYERFAPLYEEEGFGVYLWEATRIWECAQCGNEMEEKRTIKPKCLSKNCKSTSQVLKGLKENSRDIFKSFEH
jgi:hypothetical protein